MQLLLWLLCWLGGVSLGYADTPAQKTVFASLNPASHTEQPLTLDYRLAEGITVSRIEANAAGQTVPLTTLPYPYPNATTAILLLIDTSDPRRQALLNTLVQTLDRLLNAAKPHQQFGLASFDSRFTLLKPIGSPLAELRGALTRLTAQGRTTELYRTTLQALDLLAQTPASRRIVWLFSDGLAEDTAYTRQEVVNAANTQNIMLVSFGYPASVAASVHLQGMRRLAEETGGLFFSADTQHQLPTTTAASLWQHLDNGGRLVPDLQALHGLVDLNMTWITSTQPWQQTWPLQRPVAVQPVPTSPHPPQQPTTPEPLLRYQLALLVLLGLWLALKRWHAHHHRPIDAWLELIATTQVYPVTETSFTIGRSADNHLMLANDSVSAHHAVLHRHRNGQWHITDLKSVNGVYIDSQAIDHAILQPNVVFELGEVKLRLKTEGDAV